MVIVLEALGIRTESHHHEVGGPGQGEIDLRFLPLLEMADALQLHKYVVKNTAKQAGKTATFMPKPIFEENGSGMHVHQSLWKDGETLMHDAGGYALLSPLALQYAAGLLDARAGAAGVLRAVDELLPPAGPGLRGARCCSSTRSATGRPPSGSRCTRRRRRPSGSSSGPPTRSPTRTSPSRR